MLHLLRSLFKTVSSKSNVETPLGSIDEQLQSLVVEQRLPGMAVTLIKEGRVFLEKGYGCAAIAGKVAVDPRQHCFRLASISKCITGLAFGKMVEAGILHWDDSFYKHVPYYPKKEHDFSLRQLATHTAGIRSYKGKEFALNQPFSIKESINVFKEDPLLFKPGTEYLYNSFDFVLLSLAMQEAAGIPFETYVKQSVLQPLGMQHTLTPKEVHALQGTAAAGRQVHYYTKRRTGFKPAIAVNNFYKLAGGGYLSTSADIAKMGQAILNKELLAKETYDQLFAAQKIAGKSTYYGLGFQVSQDAQGRDYVGHVGSSVGAYTNFYVYPKEKVVISLLINSTNPQVQPFLDVVYDNFLKNSVSA